MSRATLKSSNGVSTSVIKTFAKTSASTSPHLSYRFAAPQVFRGAASEHRRGQSRPNKRLFYFETGWEWQWVHFSHPQHWDEESQRCKRGSIFAEPDNPNCPIASFKKYLSLCPPDTKASYLHLLKKDQQLLNRQAVCYSCESMAHNFLGLTLPKISRAFQAWGAQLSTLRPVLRIGR